MRELEFAVVDEFPPRKEWSPQPAIWEPRLREVMEVAPGKVVRIALFDKKVEAYGACGTVRKVVARKLPGTRWEVHSGTDPSTGRPGVFVRYNGNGHE